MKSATTSGVRYAAGSPTSYRSCSATVSTLTAPPVPAGLVSVNVPSARHVRDGVADVRQVVWRRRRCTTAAGGLGAALDQVPGHGRGRQPVQVVRRSPSRTRGPAGPTRQRRVGDAARDHDGRAAGQGLGDGRRAEVGVGADHAGRGPRRAARRCRGVASGCPAASSSSSRGNRSSPRHDARRAGRPARPSSSTARGPARAGVRVHAAGVGDDFSSGCACKIGARRSSTSRKSVA